MTQTDEERKAKQKERRAKPENKAKRKEIQSTLEYKAYQKDYNSKPENKAKRKETHHNTNNMECHPLKQIRRHYHLIK